MIDFGLAGLFDRFEKEFGRTLTRALLGLIGVTIVVVSLGLIAQFVWALYQWTTDTIEGTSMVWLAARAVGFISGIGCVIGLPMFISWAFESKALLDRAQSGADEAMEILRKTKLLHEEADLLHRELTTLRAEALQAKDAPTAEAPDSQSPEDTE